MNRYGFAGGNPVSFIELDGHIGGLPEEDLRELRKAGYTYVMGKGVVPLPGNGSSGGGRTSGVGTLDPSSIDQLLDAELQDLTGLDRKELTDALEEALRHAPCGNAEIGNASPGNSERPAFSSICLLDLSVLRSQQVPTTAGILQVLVPGNIDAAVGSGSSSGGGPTPKDIVQDTARRVAARGWAWIESQFSDAQRAAINRKGAWLRRVYAGTVIHEETNNILRAQHGSRFRYSSKAEVDFTDTVTGQRIELTTTAGVARHWAYQRYFDPTTQYATYDLP
jgi:hypothetical protein